MTNLERNKISPFPGIMDLGKDNDPWYVAADKIVSMTYVDPEELQSNVDLREMAKLYGAAKEQGCLLIDILDKPETVMVAVDSKQYLRTYAQIWSMERIRR